MAARLENPLSATDESTLQDVIFGIIAKEANIDRSRISVDSTLKDLGVSSLDAAVIIFEIGDRFDVTMPDHDVNFDIGTAGGLVAAVAKLLAEKPGAT